MVEAAGRGVGVASRVFGDFRGLSLPWRRLFSCVSLLGALPFFYDDLASSYECVRYLIQLLAFLFLGRYSFLTLGAFGGVESSRKQQLEVVGSTSHSRGMGDRGNRRCKSERLQCIHTARYGSDGGHAE